MLIMFDFAVVQVRYLRAAMDQIVAYSPDGLTAAQVTALLTGAATVRADYVDALTAIQGARADRRLGIETLHDYCVDFSAQALSRYRKVPEVVERLQRLPVQDKTFQETTTRASAIIALWATLPPLGTPPAAFTFGHGLDDVGLADFTAVSDVAVTVDAGLPAVDQAFQKQEGVLRLKQEELDDFATAALEQGRSRYDEGTVERDLIDAVPTEPAQQPPAQAVISSAAQTAPGTVHLIYDAAHGTSFDVLHRVAGGSGDFTLIGDDVIEREFDATGLAAGQTHEFKVIPRNARGLGPESDPASVAVT